MSFANGVNPSYERKYKKVRFRYHHGDQLWYFFSPPSKNPGNPPPLSSMRAASIRNQLSRVAVTFRKLTNVRMFNIFLHLINVLPCTCLR
ncbi:MAG: hypothetical protein KBF37_07875 [Saprospiraceae bacterium]|nr:hypothetical protein [Saprospiraceae bacterium]MBP9210221.1 hypothetical protein [Saprospiraceae bacterium]